MRAITRWMFVGAVLLTGCSEQRSPVTTAEESEVRPMATMDARRLPMERLARRVAMALADPEFRAYVRRSLDASPYAERKLPFSRFVGAEGDRAGLAMARAEGEDLQAVAMDVRDAGTLEFYFPVPAHAAGWRGDERILVATEVNDHEAPVAFDVHGKRIVLDPETPPSIPVLAVVPQETDFEGRSAIQGATCTTCGGEGGYPPADPPLPPTSPAPPSLHMTYFRVTQDFEGWLKGNPEYEVHVMAPASQTDTTHYRTLYCIGEGGTRSWNNDNELWSGDITLMNGSELAAFHASFPLNNYSILAIEDDDGQCEIRVDQDRMAAVISAITAGYENYKSVRDSIGLNNKTLKAAKSAWNILVAVANFFKTNDDLIGIAVANSVTGYYSEASNWSWIGSGLNRYGGVKLELR
jgi:hypothetical protein